MKSYIHKLILPAVMLAAVFAASCRTASFDSFGFDSGFGPDSRGTTIMYVDSQVENLYVQGSIEVWEGWVELEYTSPDGKTELSLVVAKGESVKVSRLIPASRGFWKLSYRSMQGRGRIDLHAEIWPGY